MWLLLDITVRVVVGVLLIAAGSAKLTSTPHWRELWVASYQLLPGHLVAPVARTLPAVEVACGLALVLGASGGAAAVSLLLASLSLVTVSAMARGLTVSCGCFGEVGELLTWRITGRNLTLAAGCAAVALYGHAAPALGDRAWPIQAVVLCLVFTATAMRLVQQRHATQQRHLDHLVLASKLGASSGTDTSTHNQPNRQPVTTGGT